MNLPSSPLPVQPSQYTGVSQKYADHVLREARKEHAAATKKLKEAEALQAEVNPINPIPMVIWG